MPELRIRVVIEGTLIDGSYMDTEFDADTTYTIEGVDEMSRGRLQLGAAGGGADTLDMNSEALRRGVLEVEFLAVRPDQNIFVSRNGDVNDRWLVRSGCWFVVPIGLTGGAGMNTDVLLENTVAGSPEANVDLIIAGT